MGLLSSLFERRSLDAPLNQWPWKATAYTSAGMPTATGLSISPASAMRTSAVYACVRVRAETVASLPWRIYRRLPGGGKEPYPAHPLYRLLHDQPNPEQTAIEFRENAAGHLDLWGVAYAEIEWDDSGQARALWPMRPDRVREEVIEGRRYYLLTLPDGATKALPEYRVWCTHGFMGMSVIAQARETIGLGMAGEQYGARFFGNDARPGGVLKSPNKLTPESAAASKESWEMAHAGLDNAHRVAVLQEGLEWQAVGMPNKDAQFLELRQFQVTDIARFFRVPPHKIADLDKATFSNIEHQSIEFVTDCIRPICVRFEQSALRALFAEDERKTWFAEHVIDGLLRGDTPSRYAAYAIARNWGWMSADDVRELENLNPLPDDQGKIYLVPMNMIPASQVGQGQSEQGQQGAARAARRLVAEALQRALRREEADVMRQARKLAPAALAEWLPAFYDEHRAFTARALEPVAIALADIGAIMPRGGAVADAYVTANRDGLEQIIARGGNVADALQQQFDGWRDSRAVEIAARWISDGGPNE